MRKRTKTDLQISENTYSNPDDDKKTIFKTFKGDDSHDDMKKLMRLMKNRLSARKCRQKKKSYVVGLEKQIVNLKDEIEKYKQIFKSEKTMEHMINLVE
jgi:hypothetical protein